MKAALFDPEGTDKDVGTVRELLLLDSATGPPNVLESVTVQVDDVPALRTAGAHPTEVTVAGVLRDTCAVAATLLSVAVIVAV